jgi:hypothetical protein
MAEMPISQPTPPDQRIACHRKTGHRPTELTDAKQGQRRGAIAQRPADGKRQIARQRLEEERRAGPCDAAGELEDDQRGQKQDDLVRQPGQKRE